MKHRIFRCCKQKLRQYQHLLMLPLVLTITVICCFVPAYGYSDVITNTEPVLVTGSPLDKGAVYRIPKVAGNIDALVAIKSIVNSTVLGVDRIATHFGPAFQAKIETHASEAYVEFEISFTGFHAMLDHEVPIDVSVLNLYNSNSYDQLTPISGFIVETGSLLAISSPGPQVLTIYGTGGKLPLPTFGDRLYMSTVKGIHGESILYRVGADSPSLRSATLAFGAIDFIDPIFRNVDELPHAHDDVATVDFNRALTVAAPGLLLNDIKANGSSEVEDLTVERFEVAGESVSADSTVALSQGHVTVNSNGAFQFLPAPDFSGAIPDIRYAIQDSDVGRDDAYLRLSINKESILPIALDDVALLSRSVSSQEKITTIHVLENDSDPDGFLDHESLVLLSSHSDAMVNETGTHSVKTLFVEGEGHWSVNPNGTISFQSLANSAQKISPLTYRVADDDGYYTSAQIVLQDDEPEQQLILTIDEDANNDGWINSEELRGQIDISLSVPDSAIAGERVRVAANDAELEIEISAEAILEGRIAATFPQPNDGSVFAVAARYFDISGNLIASASDSAVVDIMATAAPAVVVVADTDNSGFLSLLEYADELEIRIELPAGAVVNDRVEVRIGTRIEDIVLSPLDIADGELVVRTAMPTEGSTLSVLIRIFDEAGNVSDIASDSVVIDTTAPLPPSVNPLITASSTPLVTGEMPETGDFILSVTVNGVIYASGDGNLTETGDGGWQLRIPVLDQLPNGTYDVEAVLTDMAGNVSFDTTANELKVDLVLPGINSADIGPVSDPAPLISGATDQQDSSIVTVSTAGNVFVCSAVVEAGDWSCRSQVLLPLGESQLIASIADQVGNIGVAEINVTIAESSDQDGDGIPDDIEGADDTDGDGVPNFLDLDSDNDTIADGLETAIDSDGDQTRDFLDLDSDNDSLSDLYEAGFSKLVDKDENGAVDSAIVLGDNGLADVIEVEKDSGHTKMPGDTDNDGLADYIDLDSDGDGLADKVEQKIGQTNNTQVITVAQDDQANSELLSAVDTDRDGVPDYLDLDSDQDGVTDVLESYGIDADHDGRLDNIVDENNDGIADIRAQVSDLDIDGDGLYNHQDLDSDADMLSDLIESGGIDSNTDGIHDSWIDQNQNGIHDDVDVAFTGGVDTDSDSIDDLYDVDFKEESDTDGDGIIDLKDVDGNGNGRPDLLEDQLMAVADTDGDGVADMFQSNAQNTIATGTGAFGCSLSSASRKQTMDPSLLLLLAWFVAGALRRRGFYSTQS